MIRINAYEISETELFADELPMWPSGCPYGHIESKYVFILTKLNMLNETIKEIIELDSMVREKEDKREYIDSELSLRPFILKMRFCSELKISTDDLIALNCILHDYFKTKTWPNKVRIDCIASLLKMNFPEGFERLSTNKETLEKLNGLGNAIKHSFVNTESLWYRIHRPKSKILGFYQHYNNRNYKIKAFETDLESFVKEYNVFLSIMKHQLRNNYHQQTA